MPHPIRKLALDRRSFLRGTGVAIGLPVLDAMTPALTAPAEAPRRVMFIFAPNGKKMDEWRPRGSGLDTLPYLLEPLAPLRKRLTVLSGLALDAARAHGDGPGDHARSAAAFLTAAHPKKTGGTDIFLGQSIDQLLARSHGQATDFPSLELGMEGGRLAGSCDSGYSCAYSNNIAWKDPTTPVTKETDPRAVFARLFGDPEEIGDSAARERRAKRLGSILDLALDDLKRLRTRVGQADRAKLDQYTDAIRELERRLERTTSEGPEVEVPETIEEGRIGPFSERVPLMYELARLAFETDRTRIVTFMLGNAGSNRSYRWLKIPGGHHNLSHHRGDKSKLADIREINRWHVEQFAAFLKTMQDTRDGGSNLLDRSAVLYGSGISDGNRHNHDDLPVIVAGRLGDRFRAGAHLQFRRETPLANLHLSVLRALDVPAESFADSTGTLPILR